MEWLKEIRRRKGLTQEEIAEQALIRQPSYCNIEKGRRKPTTNTAKRIATILEFDWTLFFEEGNSKPKS